MKIICFVWNVVLLLYCWNNFISYVPGLGCVDCDEPIDSCVKLSISGRGSQILQFKPHTSRELSSTVASVVLCNNWHKTCHSPLDIYVYVYLLITKVSSFLETYTTPLLQVFIALIRLFDCTSSLS